MAKAAFDLAESDSIQEFKLGNTAIRLNQWGYFTVAEEIAWNQVGIELPQEATQAEYEFKIVKALLVIRSGGTDYKLDHTCAFPQIHALYQFFWAEREAGMPQVAPSGGEKDPKTP